MREASMPCCKHARRTEGESLVSISSPGEGRGPGAVSAANLLGTSEGFASWTPAFTGEPSVSIRASNAPGTASTSVSSTISASTPATGAGTSCVTLSVSSSTRGSLTATVSPTCFSQARTTALVPSCSSGTRTSIIVLEAHQPLDLGADAGDRRQHGFEQGRMMRAGDIRHGDARHRRVEVQEGLVGNYGGDLSAEAAGAQILMDDQAAARRADAVQHHLLVPRHQGSQVEDIGAEPLRR